MSSSSDGEAAGDSDEVGGAGELFGDAVAGVDVFGEDGDDFGDEDGASAAMATPTTATKMSARTNKLRAI
ncbi:hypothetical protein A2U01_0084352, partial [Trifolium medium]|nr:hypothetical protein [Trifolium medium]